METLETREVFGWRVSIVADPEPTDPREWDHVGTMVCSHRSYRLGDRDLKGFEDGAELLADLEADPDVLDPILPLYLFDHSGLAMSTSSARFAAVDSAGWDWGMVGVIYATRSACEAIGCDTDPETVERILRAEVEEYDAYLRGDVVGVVVEGPHGEHESCWGFMPEGGSDPWAYVWDEGMSWIPSRVRVVAELREEGMGL